MCLAQSTTKRTACLSNLPSRNSLLQWAQDSAPEIRTFAAGDVKIPLTDLLGIDIFLRGMAKDVQRFKPFIEGASEIRGWLSQGDAVVAYIRGTEALLSINGVAAGPTKAAESLQGGIPLWKREEGGA